MNVTNIGSNVTLPRNVKEMNTILQLISKGRLLFEFKIYLVSLRM